MFIQEDYNRGCADKQYAKQTELEESCLTWDGRTTTFLMVLSYRIATLRNGNSGSQSHSSTSTPCRKYIFSARHQKRQNSLDSPKERSCYNTYMNISTPVQSSIDSPPIPTPSPTRNARIRTPDVLAYALAQLKQDISPPDRIAANSHPGACPDVSGKQLVQPRSLRCKEAIVSKVLNQNSRKMNVKSESLR